MRAFSQGRQISFAHAPALAPPSPRARTVLAPSLRALMLDGNRLQSLAQLAALSRLELLTASRNRLRGLAGLGGLPALRRLGVAGNLIGCLEDVAPLVGASLLGDLDLRGNELGQVRWGVLVGVC